MIITCRAGCRMASEDMGVGVGGGGVACMAGRTCSEGGLLHLGGLSISTVQVCAIFSVKDSHSLF